MKDVIGIGVANVPVRFTVAGAVTTSGLDTTKANGEATFCYHGPPLPGSDKITAVAETG